MDSVGKRIFDIFSDCDICLNGSVISKELLIQTFTEFVARTIEDEDHNIGIVMHTGSICFDVAILACAAISNILYNGTSAEETVKMLLPDDVVLYYQRKKKVRCKFKGFVNSVDDKPGKEGKIAVLEQEKSHLKSFVPQKLWQNIVPYYGNSTSMDGRGLRRESEEKKLFFQTVLGINPADIPRTIDMSTVVIMTRDYADQIVNGLTFSFHNNSVRLTELITASYYTDDDQEYPYAGNEAKSEPVLKITSRASVARKLLLKRGGNRHVGLIVIGDDQLRRGEFDLPDLIGRKSLQYVYLCANIDSENAEKLLLNEESAKLFACTKDFLVSHSLPPICHNPYTDNLNRQTYAIIEKQIEPIEVRGCLTWENYKKFKEAIYRIKSSDFDSDEKEEFVIQAYSLMNLLLTAVFPIQLLNRLVKGKIIENTTAPEERLARIRSCTTALPEYLQTDVRSALVILERTYSELEKRNPKDFALRKQLTKCKGDKTVIVVPKAYYITVFNYMNLLPVDTDRIKVVTANKFSNKELYDAIITVGSIEGTKFNMFRCRSAQNIYALLYEPETLHYRKTSSMIAKAEKEYAKRAVIEYYRETDDIPEDEVSKSAEEVERIDEELKAYINGAAVKAYGSYIGNASGSKNMMAEVIAIATFDTEEIAFFSKNYKAYVLDEDAKTVREVKTAELSEGDTVIFTRSTEKTRDVVDDLLRKMIDENRVSNDIERDYRKSRIWKTKLIDYMTETNADPGTIANAMIKNGVSVQEPTIRGWLDEDSHTVGPRKLDSIQQIALLTGDEVLFDNAEDVFRACAEVRRVRGRIMEAIGRAVLSGITGVKNSTDPIFDVVYEQIGELSVMLQIETISFVKECVPINIINRPIVAD